MRVPRTSLSAGISAAVIEENTTHFSRAREEDVQPALTAFSGYRTKVKEGARLVCRNTIAHRDKYHVTLVALNCFQIFHEQTLFFWRKSFNIRTNAELVDHIIHRVALLRR